MSSLTRASYTDSFEHAFDAKGRITVPAEWREESYESRLFVFPSAEKCLKVYPETWLSRLQEQISGLKNGDPLRKRVEDLASIAQSTTWDQQGRIMIKEKLRSGADLKKRSHSGWAVGSFSNLGQNHLGTAKGFCHHGGGGAKRHWLMSSVIINFGTYPADTGPGQNRMRG